MRFNSPDSLSPFGRGGLNPYAYCLGDPVNFSDPTGRLTAIARILSSLGTLFNSVITLRPGIPFQVGMDALVNGAIYRLPLRQSAGAIAVVSAGSFGVVGGVLGIGSAVVAAINPTSAILAPLAYSTLGATAVSVVSRAGSYWAARNPAILPALKSLAEKSMAVNPLVASVSTRSNAMEMESFFPSASLPAPGAVYPLSRTRGIKRGHDGNPVNKLVAKRKIIRQT